MADYRAPLKEIRFTLEHVADLGGLAKLPGCENAEPDLVAAVLEEAGKFAEGVLGPLNRVGDQEGAKFENGVVRTPTGFADAYKQFAEAGWNGVPFDPAFGGGGLPWAISIAVQEMMTSANMAFCLCPLLTQGAVEMMSHHGTEEQKATYLANMVTGKWTGTMNLTEPQAGSDVGALRTRAEPAGDGTYRITGQKIFITFGEHDMAENIIHLVLARLPGAPGGTRGISCFIVPKFLVNKDGSLGAHNDLRCVSIEEKLGIHGSPTCVMSYGDQGGAIGFLIGEENKGMRAMFTMMNNARLSVGLQGLAIAERAYQQAVAFARERKQGTPPRGGAGATIVEHPDVRRMLLTMRSQIEAMRGLIYLNAQSIDRAHHHPDAAERAKAQALVDLLTPVSKGWSTDLGVEISSLGVQVHGGMGFIEETGAAQHLRDSRIAPIYEGTNGIQALDLVMRKLPLEGGETVKRFIGEMKAIDAELGAAKDSAFAVMRSNLKSGVAALETATEWLAKTMPADPAAAAAGATPYLRMFGVVAGGYLLAKGALAAAKLKAEGADPQFHDAKVASARFYAEQILPQAAALAGPVMAGTDAIYAIPAELLSA
jgi:alkylation response protein AidB-like acyl-CoA dehydrogenase